MPESGFLTDFRIRDPQGAQGRIDRRVKSSDPLNGRQLGTRRFASRTRRIRASSRNDSSINGGQGHSGRHRGALEGFGAEMSQSGCRSFTENSA
jgi:hypothetical protein